MNTEFLESLRPAVERVGWTLVHSTWQGAGIAIALWVVLFVMGKRSATRRYAVSCLALVAIVAAMAVTFVRAEGMRRVLPVAGGTEVPVVVQGRIADAPVRVVTGQPDVAAARDVRARIAPWLSDVVGVWAIGVAGLAAWHCGGWVRVRRMTHAGAAREWEGRAREIARRMGVSRGVRVVESALAGVPAVVGFVRPVILLPVGLATEMSVGQVEAILAHELAHVRRNDYFVNLMQTAIETLLFYHPAVWWISGQIRQEREHCCDDLAVDACGDRVAYARALARVEEVCGGNVPLATAADGGSLLSRVRRIIAAESHAPRRAEPLAAVVVAVTCAAAVIVLADWPARAADSKPATRPTSARAATQGARSVWWNGARVVPVRPADLVPTAAEYRIAQNDLLMITVAGSDGAKGETVLSRRVNPAGKINLSQVGELPAAGLTEPELEQAITKAYREAKPAAAAAKVSVQLAEARGATFSIVGPGIKQAGEYPIPRPDLRLTDALNMAGGAPGESSTLGVIRGAETQRQVIEVPVSALLAGDKEINVIVRPGDMLVVKDSERTAIMVVVGRDEITWNGISTSLAGLEQAMRTIPPSRRARTQVMVCAASDDVPVGRFMSVFNACATMAQGLGLDVVQNAGVQPRAREVVPATGEYYMEGRIARPGVYSCSGRTITLAQAMISAGMPTDGGTYVTVIRRDGDRRVAVAENVVVADLLGKRVEDVALRPNDLVRVSAEKQSSFGQDAGILPAPHAGEVGEVYVGGHVRRPGVYSLSGRKITVGQILVSAGGLDDPKADAVEVRRRDGKNQETLIRGSVRTILDGTAPDLFLQPNDEVTFSVPPAVGK